MESKKLISSTNGTISFFKSAEDDAGTGIGKGDRKRGQDRAVRTGQSGDAAQPSC